jgi:hypothetical protein
VPTNIGAGKPASGGRRSPPPPAKKARKKAEEQNLRLEKLAGSMRLLQKLADGDYEGDEFLVVPPGCEIEADYTGCVMRVKR